MTVEHVNADTSDHASVRSQGNSGLQHVVALFWRLTQSIAPSGWPLQRIRRRERGVRRRRHLLLSHVPSTLHPRLDCSTVPDMVAVRCLLGGVSSDRQQPHHFLLAYCCRFAHHTLSSLVASANPCTALCFDLCSARLASIWLGHLYVNQALT